MGTGFASSFADRGFATSMVVEGNMVVGIDYIGTVQVGTRLVHVQPEGTPHFSISMYQLFSLSRAGMLYTHFHHVLPIYKIYKISLQGYLQPSAKTNIPHHSDLLTGIYDTRVALAHLMGWVHQMRHKS